MKASEVTVEWLKEHLEGWEGSNGSYAAWCPVHDDMGTSVKGLSVNVRGTGKVVAKCHSAHCGATLTDVIRAIEGGEHSNGFHVNVKSHRSDAQTPSLSGKGGMQWWVEHTGVPQEVWAELGCVEYGKGVGFEFEGEMAVKVRNPPKEIMWVDKDQGTPPVWPIPGRELPEHIMLTEGESDCGTARVAQLPLAFAVTKGAETPLSVAAFQTLASRGVREVTIAGDADQSGDEFKTRTMRAAVEAGLTCNVIDLTEIADPFHTMTDLNAVWHECGYDVAEFKKAIEKCTKRIANEFPVLSYDDLMDLAEKEIPWLITELLAPHDKVLIAGPQKAFKTWITLELCRTLATGKAFLERSEWTPKKPVKTLLVEEEGSPQKFAMRCRKMGLSKKEQQYFMVLHRKGIKFTQPDTITYLIELIKEHEIECVIFDPLQRMIPGVNENDAAETGIVWDEVMRMQELIPGLVVIIVHHANKSERMTWESIRGSSRHGGEVDLGLFVEKHPLEENKVRINVDGRDVYASLGPGEAFEGRVEITDTTFKIDATEVVVNVRKSKSETEGESNEYAVLLAIRNGCETRTQIMRETNLSDVTVRKYLQKFLEEGAITEEDNGIGKPKHYKEAENAD